MNDLDFSKAGLKRALIKGLNVAVYILVSMLIVGLGMFIADQTITPAQVKIPMLVAGANILIVFLQKWTSTKK